LICAPFISLNAVLADDVPGMCRQAVERGARVNVVVARHSAQDQAKRAPQAIRALQEGGATIHLLAAIHSKTLVCADRVIVEGSFNWLSAPRDRESRHANYEASFLVSGDSAKADVQRALREFTELGAKLT